MRRWFLLIVLFLILCCASMVHSAIYTTVPTSWTAGGFWVDSGITLNQGDIINVTASGSWSATLGEFYGADGTDYQWCDQFLNPNYWAGNTDHFGALICYIGETPPAVGSYETMTVEERQAYIDDMLLLGSDATVTAPVGGRLWFAMNDDAYSGNISDNQGNLHVVVTEVLTYNPTNGHYYKVIQGPFISWNSANALAAQMSYNGMRGHLLTINSNDEDDFITKYLTNRAWIGGFQLPDSTEPDGGWAWVTGEPWSYTNWDQSEPNNAAPYEDGAELMTTGKWNDRIRTSTELIAYVVEFEPGPVTNPANGHSYKVVAVPSGVKWQQARDAAIAAGGHLATLTDAAENQFVFDLAYADPNTWLQYYDLQLGPYIGGYQPEGSVEPDGGWKWVTGEPWSFTNWNSLAFTPVDPDLQLAENRAHLEYNNGNVEPTWNDVSAGSTLRGYVIEWEPPVLADDFNDNIVNRGMWSASADSGVSVWETNQRVEISYCPTATGSQFGAGFAARLGITGDFDIQTDYELLNWPAGNGVRVGLVPTWWSVHRTSLGKELTTPAEMYWMDSSYGQAHGVTTTDTSGKLRIVRTGSTVTSLYWSGDRWNPIQSFDYGASGLADVPWIGLNSWSHSYAFSGENVWLAFDNFKVNFGDIEPNYEPSKIGAARNAEEGSGVFLSGAVVTADQSVVPGSVFVESADRTSGIRLITSEDFNVGDVVSIVGNKHRVDGEYLIDNPTILGISVGEPLSPLFMNTRMIGNDLNEALEYAGINTTGFLVRTAGKVTNVFTDSNVIYVDDGAGLSDGLLLNLLKGIRVKLPAGVALPAKGDRVIVTGISRVEKFVLTNYGEVNGYWREPGAIVYVPSIWIRGSADLDTL
jgi:hypothetical protein